MYTALTTFDSYTITALIFTQTLQILGCYALLGIGIGLPIVLLASMLGWVHLLLLVSGKIDPHLAEEGFFNVLKTLYEEL
jgi:hypothetical protein